MKKRKIELGINLGFAINKYIEPEVWTKLVREEFGLDRVQFVADLLNPFLPQEYVDSQVERICRSIKEYDISVTSIFTSAFTRVNHLMHPDRECREIWVDWFKRLFNIGARLGARCGGSHFGIMTFDGYANKREYLVEEGVKNWQRLSIYAKDLGFEYLFFEPMSVPREMATTIGETRELLGRVNAGSAIPMKICLDIGHAPDPAERDPYVWLKELGSDSPIVHLQQTQKDKSNHWPFTPEHNAEGIIHADKVIHTWEESGAVTAEFDFEISHREHSDTEYRILPDLKESVRYWKQALREAGY